MLLQSSDAGEILHVGHISSQILEQNTDYLFTSRASIANDQYKNIVITIIDYPGINRFALRIANDLTIGIITRIFVRVARSYGRSLLNFIIPDVSLANRQESYTNRCYTNTQINRYGGVHMFPHAFAQVRINITTLQ